MAFNEIIAAIDPNNSTTTCFYIDGQGGSGKTYLYEMLLAYIRWQGKIALPFATTGIALALLKGGRTVHAGFKLPVPLTETSVSRMNSNSNDALCLKNSSLIIKDEISMLPNHGLRCVNLLLK
jgi:PIF1-like helicase